MGVLVLVILEQARQHLSVHPNEIEALEALAAHVARNWRSVMKGALFPKSEAERIDLFFRAGDQDYFIAEVDVDATDSKQGGLFDARHLTLSPPLHHARRSGSSLRHRVPDESL